MKLSGVICILMLTVVSAPVAIYAQQTGGVDVSQVESQIKLTVDEPTSLNRVLDELCRQTNSQCLGTQQARNIVVSPQVFVGGWRKVVTTLLDGADLNYVVTVGSDSPIKTLEILGVAPGPQRSVRTGSAGPDAPYDRKLLSNESELSPPANAGTEPYGQAGGQPEAAAVDAAPLSAGTQSLPGSSNQGPTEGGKLNLSADNPAGSGNRFLPFPDSFGNPIAASTYTPEYLPFPGSDGKPIPVSNPVAPSFLPFPGSDGKPIATSNQPVQYLPFPDSSGRPIPVQPASAH